MQKNIPKYNSYTIAIERINRGINEDFPLESIALCESIIFDRIYSHLHWKNKTDDITLSSNFGQLLRLLKNKSPNSKDWSMNQELLHRLERWLENRNLVIHGFARSIPTEPTPDIDSFLQTARNAAEEGKSLMRDVMKWNEQSHI